jgi:hypothetical protein
VFTDRLLILFKIVDKISFKLNVDFDNCLREVSIVELNQIENLELSQCQNYLVIENVRKDCLKFVTYDTNLSQVFLNSLISNKCFLFSYSQSFFGSNLLGTFALINLINL